MSSRYYNNPYMNSPPYNAPYRARQYRKPQKGKPGGNPPYSPTLGRKKPIGHWKAKKKPNKDDEEKKTKLGEFNQESIEAELNKYKKGVFYHDDEPKINGHDNSQYQLTRTQQAPPQLYEELPRPVPPNYDERVKTTDRNDDSKSREEDKPKATKKEKKRKSRVRKKRDRGVVTIAPYAAGGRGGGYPQDYYYYPQDYYYAPQPRYPPADYTYGYTTTTTSYPYDHGVIQDDGSWYPYPDILHQQPPPQAYVDPYATPKQSRTQRRNGPKGANVDLTTPVQEDSNKAMSPGRRVNKIQKQLEYYFSSHNMNNDEFLRDSMDTNGWVSIDVIVAFNRMKVLGATKDLVVEAAYHSTTIEIDSKNPDKIRMTKLWRQYISEKNKKERKKKVSSSRQREKELDAAELNPTTIEKIVASIERKNMKRRKRREQREKEKKAKEEDNKEEEVEKKEKKKEAEKAEDEDGDDPDVLNID
eukprot:168098_1